MGNRDWLQYIGEEHLFFNFLRLTVFLWWFHRFMDGLVSNIYILVALWSWCSIRRYAVSTTFLTHGDKVCWYNTYVYADKDPWAIIFIIVLSMLIIYEVSQTKSYGTKMWARAAKDPRKSFCQRSTAVYLRTNKLYASNTKILRTTTNGRSFKCANYTFGLNSS